MKTKHTLFLLLLISNYTLTGQSISKSAQKFEKSETRKIEKHIAKKQNNQNKYLRSFDKKQAKILNELCEMNPGMSDALSKSWNASRQLLERKLVNENNRFSKPAYLTNWSNDSLLTALSYVSEGNAQQTVESYYKQQQNDQFIREYFNEQTAIMKQMTNRVPGFKKQFKGLSKDNYYFYQQTKEYDKTFATQNKLERSILTSMKIDDSYAQFLNSSNHGIARPNIPDSWGSSLEGLQTVKQTSNLQKSTLSNTDSAGFNKIINNIFDANEVISSLKGSGSKSASEVPDFKPNPMKTKRFTDRLNYGYDFQFNGSQSKFLSTDLSLGLNLKYNITSIIALGYGAFYVFDLRFSKNQFEKIRENLAQQVYSDVRLNRTLFATSVINRLPDTKNVRSDYTSPKNFYNINYLAGLKFKVPISGKSSCVTTLLYNFSSGKENDFAIKFGFEY